MTAASIIILYLVFFKFRSHNSDSFYSQKLEFENIKRKITQLFGTNQKVKTAIEKLSNDLNKLSAKRHKMQYVSISIIASLFLFFTILPIFFRYEITGMGFEKWNNKAQNYIDQDEVIKAYHYLMKKGYAELYTGEEILKGLINKGLFQEAEKFIKNLGASGNCSAFSAILIRAYGNKNSINDAERIYYDYFKEVTAYRQFINIGLGLTGEATNALLDAYISVDNLDKAEEFMFSLDKWEEGSDYLYRSIIIANLKKGERNSALRVCKKNTKSR